MSLSVMALRPRYTVRILESADDSDRRIRRATAAAWGLLFMNVLTFTPGISILHIPYIVGKGITQASLPLALLIALTINRKIVIRPNIFLFLVSLLAMEAVVTGLQLQYFGTAYRTFRFAEFVVALWLLTPQWGRRDLLLVRCHLTALSMALGSVLLGLLVAPGHAFYSGRLTGVIWSIPPTQAGHYAAVVIGLAVVLWLGGRLRGGVTIFAVTVTGACLLLTHTRTALAGLAVGIAIAVLSLISSNARARKLLYCAGVVSLIATLTFHRQLISYLVRGEGSQQLANLSGRTVVWGWLISMPRDRFHEIFGTGLSNGSFVGHAIDSNWLVSYQEQGLLGVAICAAILICLFTAAFFQPCRLQRALILFLAAYCLVASFMEVGFTDTTPYLLDLTVAASMLIPNSIRHGLASRSSGRQAPP